MANQSKGPLQIVRLDLEELNDVLRRIQDELDSLNGLRGGHNVFGAFRYKDGSGQVLHSWGSNT